MRYVIVGNGVAGTKAAETIRKRAPGSEVIVLSEEAFPFYRRPSLVEHLRGRVPRDHLWGYPPSFYQEAGIDLRLKARVIDLNPRAHELTLADGKTLPYDRLLLAPGVRPQPHLLPGGDLEGIHTLRTLADVALLQDLSPRARQAVVVGENVLGLEMARALLSLGLSVTYLLRSNHFWPEVLSPDAAALVEERLRGEGVEVRPQSAVQAFLGGDGRVQAVQTPSGEVPVQVVGFADNLWPHLPWAQKAGLHLEDRLWVDEHLATNQEDIFAAGDAVRLPNEVLAFGWQRAWHQGIVAGVNLTGRGAPYRQRTISLSTRAFGLPILVMGNPNPRGSKVRRERGDYPVNGILKEIVLDDEQRVVGATMVGDIGEASAVEELVRQQAPYREVPEELKRRLFDLRYWGRAGNEVLCPVCKFLMQVGEEEVKAGRVACPICGVEFELRRTGDRFVIVME